MKELFVHFTLINAPKTMRDLKTTIFWKVTSYTDDSEVPARSQFSFVEDLFSKRGIVSLS